MKITAICVLIVLACFTFGYACIRNDDDQRVDRTVRQTVNINKQARQREKAAEAAAAAAAEMIDGESPAMPPTLELISAEDEISISDAELLLADITEDGNVTSNATEEESEEDLIDIILKPGKRRRCKASAITPLDDDQKATLTKHKKKFKILEKNRRVLKKINARRSVVKLTKRQRIEVKAYLSGSFMKADSLPDIGGGAIANSSSESLSRRRRSNSTYRVCEPVYSWNNVYLTVDSNGTLVQVIQLNEDDSYQWFMEETCQSQISSIVNADCDEAERLHLAYVINLTTGNIEQTYVVVYCCVGLSVL